MQSIKTLFAAIERIPLWKVYVFFAMPIGLFLVFATPPFQTPDAANHFYRAIQISEGQWRAYRFDGTSGGRIDASVVKFAAAYEPMEARANIKASRAIADATSPLQWNGERVNTGFPNTAIYPPFAYLPQALAVAVGRVFHLTVLNTYKLTCMVGLLVSMLLTAVALGVARKSTRFIFFVALLPTTLMISASVSQEVVVIPLCFLVIAYFERFIALQRVLQGRWRWLFGAAIALCASARPPYGALVLLLFYPGLKVSTDGAYRFWIRVALAAAIGAVSFFAMQVFQSPAWTPAAPPRSVPGQLDFLFRYPTAVFRIAFETMRANASFYGTSFIGVLGWLDTPLAGIFYSTASVAGVAALIAVSLERDPLDRAGNTRRLMLMVPMLVGSAMTFVALYLTWTPVGQLVVDGVQGRYLTALVPLLALATPKLAATKGRDWGGMSITRQFLTLIVLTLPFFTFEQVVTAVINRFYLQ